MSETWTFIGGGAEISSSLLEKTLLPASSSSSSSSSAASSSLTGTSASFFREMEVEEGGIGVGIVGLKEVLRGAIEGMGEELSFSRAGIRCLEDVGFFFL